MEIENICCVCRADIGKYMCNACNARVCEKCRDKKSGMCIICKGGIRI